MRKYLLVLVVLLCSQAQSSQVFKCVDGNGRVTFTQHNCPSNSSPDGSVSARNAAPSGSSAPTKMADTTPRPPREKYEGQKFTVVGEPAPKPVQVAPVQDRQVTRPSVSGQPCIKMVEKLINNSYTNKKGQRIGSAQIIKVPVAC